jgi:hypothetical protein
MPPSAAGAQSSPHRKKRTTVDKGSDLALEQPDFSLVLGGPLYQLLLRARLIRPSMDLVHRRVIAAAAITWLPLAALTALGGGFLGGYSVPFIYDFEVHVRLLLALPMLIGAELIVHRRVWTIVDQFRRRSIIAPEDRRAFDALISRAMRLRNSVPVELLLVVLSLTVGYWVWRTQASLHVATWYATTANDEISFTWAGYWYVLVSVPIFRFILLRWYFRLFIWYFFLFRVSRMRLHLNALHPDRAGGLGFLGLSADAIAPVLVAQTVFLAGVVANQIWYEGATLLDYKILLGGAVGFLMLIALLPMVFFAFQMVESKRTALREYGFLAAQYTNEFRQKWLHGVKSRDRELLGSSDIQSLADLANSYAVVAEMKPLPIDRSLVVRLAVLIALPLAPLALTMFPFEVLLQQLIKVVL